RKQADDASSVHRRVVCPGHTGSARIRVARLRPHEHRQQASGGHAAWQGTTRERGRHRPMTRKRRRLWLILTCGLALGSAAALVLSAFSDNLVFFVSPSDLVKLPRNDRTVRLGGLVEQGSVQRAMIDGKPAVSFRVTDGASTVKVTYVGVLPDLFREGQGVV